VLPLGGSPYVVDVFKTDDMNALPVLQREVAGYIEEYSPKNFVIHPSFCESNAKWALAERLRKLPKTMAYVNEDGGRKCSINCGTVITDPRMRLGGCPHLFGNVVLAVYQSALAKAGISTADLRQREEEEELVFTDQFNHEYKMTIAEWRETPQPDLSAGEWFKVIAFSDNGDEYHHWVPAYTP